MIKPHILLTLVDDWGWANAGWHQKSPEVTTPQMDELVSSGIELDRAYAFCFCSPSRSALQSGRSPYHVNVENSEPSVHNKTDLESGYAGIPRSMTTIATKLSSANYSTAMFGKWDSGRCERVRIFCRLVMIYCVPLEQAWPRQRIRHAAVATGQRSRIFTI